MEDIKLFIEFLKICLEIFKLIKDNKKEDSSKSSNK